MAQVVAALLPLSLFAFWAWMFWDMLRNQDLPGCFITLSRGADPRSDWTLSFLVLNVFTALFYFVNVYRYKH